MVLLIVSELNCLSRKKNTVQQKEQRRGIENAITWHCRGKNHRTELVLKCSHVHKVDENLHILILHQNIWITGENRNHLLRNPFAP